MFSGKCFQLTKQLEKHVFNQLTSTQIIVRHGHRLRGKAPGVARTLEQRLQEGKEVDPEVDRKIDIGFPQLRPSRSEQLKIRLTHVKAQRKNTDLEKLARAGTLQIDLEEVKSEWQKTNGQHQMRQIAEHYDIFEHLFGDAYFTPRVPLEINYKQSEDVYSPVYCGNTLKPTEAANQPEVTYDPTFSMTGDKVNGNDTLWTLILTNPDGHLSQENKEYVHWFVSNIPGNDIAKGSQIVPYLQPIPPKGTGFHRHVFVLYKQTKKLDFSAFNVGKVNDLEGRTFKMEDFYRKYQDDITPAGLSFFQSDWDQSITEVYHNILDIKEPVYEYDFPKAHIKEQKWFPLKEPFNIYLDKYRHPQDVAKDYLKKKLAVTNPFEPPKAPLRYPNAHPIRDVPSWLRTEMQKDRLKVGRILDV